MTMDTRSNPTDRNELLRNLTATQAIAIDAIDTGAPIAEAARVAGVDRTTVSRWVNHHPAFRAELQQRRLDRVRRNEQRLHELTTAALDAVREAVDSGDQATALQWLKIAGIRSAVDPPPEAVTPERFIWQHRAAMAINQQEDLTWIIPPPPHDEVETDLLRLLEE
jgi:hypothetical protein